MPRAITAYACNFKCGKKVDTVRKRMEVHEARCFCNPVRRACQTCIHFQADSDTIYNPYHGGNPGSTDYEAKYHYCDAREDVNLREKLVCDCPSWSNKADMATCGK